MRRFLFHLMTAAEANTQRLLLLCILALWTTVAIVGFVLSPPIGVIIFVFVLAMNARKSGRSSTTHGSASFADFSDLWRAGCLFQRSGVLLGQTIALTPPSLSFVINALLTYPLRRSAEAVAIARLRHKNPAPLAVRVPDRIPHVAVFASSGGGKSTCYAFPQLFDNPGNMVVLDSKGELCRGTAKFRHEVFGSEIVILDPYGVTEGCGFSRARFNPLDLFIGDENRIVDDSRRTANALIVRTGKEADSFWPESSCVVITAILSFLAAMARPEEATLNRMRDILSSPELMDQMLNVMMQSDKCGGLLRRLAGQVMQFQGQTKASVYSVANSHAGFLDSLALAETLAESTFDPREILKRRMTIYICLPVDRRTELAGVQRVFVSSLINMVFAAGENPYRRIRFVLDEAATLGAIDSLYNAVQFGRSFGLRMMFLFQSTSQVERCFPESQKDDFFATTGCVYASTSDYRTAKDVSDWIGQSTVLARSDQHGRNWGGSRSSDGANPSSTSSWGGNSSTSYNEVARSLLRPEEVLQLPTNLAIVLLPNVRPIFTLKVPYYTVTGRRMGGRLFNILRGSIATTVTVVLFAVAGWALTSGANDPRVIQFWERCRQVFRQR